VTEWTLDPSPASLDPGSKFVLLHKWVVPNGDPSGFGDIPYSILLRGSIGDPLPPKPELILPASNGVGLGTTVEFRWKKDDTNTDKYHFYNCANDPTASCTSEEIQSQVAGLNSNGIFYAGGGGLLLIGMTFFGGLKGRKMMALLFVIAVLFAGGTLISCGKNSQTSNNSVTPLPRPADQVSHTVRGLSSGTTYYWKVVGESDTGLLASSDIKTYTTE
jgi:hypothetical protein